MSIASALDTFPPGIPLRLPETCHTSLLGDFLGRLARPGDVIHLDGPMGAGKTLLAGAFLMARGHVGPVPSPTYAVVRSYDLMPTVHHLDLFRLRSSDEVLDLDPQALMEEGAILIVEWPAVGMAHLPSTVAVRIWYSPEGGRIARWQRTA